MGSPYRPGSPPGWYVLERVLGQGGFSITYLAPDSNLDKLVAIKEYLPVRTASTGRAPWRLHPRSPAATKSAYASVRVHSVFQHNNTA